MSDTRKTRMIGLPCGEEIVTICYAISIEYRNMTNGQMEFLYQHRAPILLCWRAIKIKTTERVYVVVAQTGRIR